MNPDQRLILVGAYISSALYLSGCFVAGIIYFHVGDAWKTALAAAGVSCIAYAAQLFTPALRWVATTSTGVSWALGMIAGLSLLLGV
jgi:hypothetical protein